jgi:hypothetical protein
MYMITVAALVALLILLAALGIMRGCNVEITFHPPIFVKIKVTRAGDLRSSPGPTHDPASGAERATPSLIQDQAMAASVIAPVTTADPEFEGRSPRDS